MAKRESWAEHAAGVLHSSGLRRGGARRAVIELLADQDCCLSAQEIFDALRARGRRVGLASVYRALEHLTEQRLVQRLDFDDAARYEPLRPGGDHHHHVVCDECGKIEPFEDRRLERALESVSGRLAFAVDEHDVVLRGSCADCRTS